MKYIFDFDDVLFHTTKQFKEHMYASLGEAGVQREEAEAYYKILKENTGRLQELLTHFSLGADVYEKILNESKNFINTEILALIEKLGKENCYIVTLGVEEFQLDKIRRAGIADLFSEVTVVSASKKEAVEKIAAEHKDETVLFVDDRASHFENLDFVKYPNLKTILYDENGYEKLKEAIDKNQ